MIDAREVKHTPKEAHNTHTRSRHSHALGPRLSDQETVKDEVTLHRIKVNVTNCNGSTRKQELIGARVVPSAVPVIEEDV